MKRIGLVSIERLLPLLALFTAACAANAPPSPRPSDTARSIEAMLLASAEAWTRGDLDGFLDDYAPDATYIGSAGIVRGRDAIRSLYAQGYWAAGSPRDALRFELLDVRVIGPATSVVVGRYLLHDRDSGRTTATGFFSLTLERRDGEWKIVHDHSSASDDG